MKTLRLRRRAQSAQRRGNITVLAAVLSVAMFGMVAFSVDVGYILSVKEEMQRTADSAAMAACWEYVEGVSKDLPPSDSMVLGRLGATDVAAGNHVGNVKMALDTNTGNSSMGDLVFGHVPDLYQGTSAFSTTNPNLFNAVKVKVRRDSGMNGEAQLFFARVFGINSTALEADASAAVVRDVAGFKAATSGSNLDLLPFTLDLPTHTDWHAGIGQDKYSYDDQSGAITAGPDGKLEVNLYPLGTGSPGNRGTVDIGGSNNSTKDIARQILHGINAADMAALGKPLELVGGELTLEGDTGISAGVKDELAAIKGEPRIIPIFREVHGPGNNAIYTIVAWQGIRIMDVKLTGPMKKKHVTIQMAPVLAEGVIQSTTTGTSNNVFSTVVLID